jgi:hypothetical protein
LSESATISASISKTVPTVNKRPAANTAVIGGFKDSLLEKLRGQTIAIDGENQRY